MFSRALAAIQGFFDGNSSKDTVCEFELSLENKNISRHKRKNVFLNGT